MESSYWAYGPLFWDKSCGKIFNGWLPGPPKRWATICPASQSCTPSSSNDLAYDCVQLVVSDPIYQLIIIILVIIIVIIAIIIVIE
jgi:hypothetical protein